MARYIVLKSDIETGREPVLVLRDDFAILALAFPLPWLLFKRLWLQAFVVFLLLAFIGYLSGQPMTFGIALISNIALGLIIALEGQGWVVGKAKRRGYREIGTVVDAHSLQEAELLAFEKFGSNSEVPVKPVKKPAPHSLEVGETDMLLGRT